MTGLQVLILIFLYSKVWFHSSPLVHAVGYFVHVESHTVHGDKIEQDSFGNNPTVRAIWKKTTEF